MTTGDEEAESLVDDLFRDVDDQFTDLEREYSQARQDLAQSSPDPVEAPAAPTPPTATPAPEGLISEVDDQFADLEREYSQARQDLALTAPMGPDTPSNALEASNERFELMSQVATLQAELSRQGDELDERDRMLNELGDKIADFEAQSANHDAMAAELHTAHQETLEERREQARLSALLDARAAERQELADVANRLQNERDHVQELLTTALSRFDEAEAQLVKMDDKVRHLEAARETESQEHHARAHELIESRAEMSKLADRLEELAKTTVDADERAEKAEALAERRANEAGYLNRRIDALNEKLEIAGSFEADATNLRRELTMAERRVTELERELASEQSETAAARAAVDAIAERTSDYDELVAQIERLEQERDEAWEAASGRAPAAPVEAEPEAPTAAPEPSPEVASLAERARELSNRRANEAAIAAQAAEEAAAQAAAAKSAADAAMIAAEPTPAGVAPAAEAEPELPAEADVEAEPEPGLAADVEAEPEPERPAEVDVEAEPEPGLVADVEVEAEPEPELVDLDDNDVAIIETDLAELQPATVEAPASDPIDAEPIDADPIDAGLIDSRLVDAGLHDAGPHGAVAPEPNLVETPEPSTSAPSTPEPFTSEPPSEPAVPALDSRPSESPTPEPLAFESPAQESPGEAAAPSVEPAVVADVDIPVFEFDATGSTSQGVAVPRIPEPAADSVPASAPEPDPMRVPIEEPAAVAAVSVTDTSELPAVDSTADKAPDEVDDAIPVVSLEHLETPVVEEPTPSPAIAGVRKRTILPADMEPNTLEAVAHLLNQPGVIAIIDARSTCGRTGIRPSELFDRVAQLRDDFDVPVEVVVTPVSTPVGGAPDLPAIGVHHVTGADTVADRIRALCMGFPADQPLVVVAGDDHVRRAAIGEEANVVEPTAVLNLPAD